MSDRSIEITPDLVAAMSRDTTAASLLRPATLVPGILLAVVVLAELALLALGRTSTTAIGFTVVIVVVLVGMPLLIARQNRRSLTSAYPVGSTVAAEVRAPRLRVVTSRSTAEVELSAFRRMEVRPATVLLRTSGSSVRTVLPRAAFTDEDLTAMRSGIGA